MNPQSLCQKTLYTQGVSVYERCFGCHLHSLSGDGLATDRPHWWAWAALGWGSIHGAVHGTVGRTIRVHSAGLRDSGRSRGAWLATSHSVRALRSLSRRTLVARTGGLRSASGAHRSIAGGGLRSATTVHGTTCWRLGAGVGRAALRVHGALARREVRTGTAGSTRAHVRTTRRSLVRSLGLRRSRLNRASGEAGARYNTLLGSIQANAERLGQSQLTNSS